MVGEHFDACDQPRPTGNRPARGRPYLGVHFSCCGVYARVYVNREDTQYVGNCPRCARHVVFRIGPGGTDARFFTVY
ncbi:MAG: hypothetical protein FJ276_07475 [Planctomycetes bacterium]|nr:hypothetical protein [Planctomycetota bacterium]